MDEQQSTNDSQEKDSSKPVSIPIVNDITPPPAPTKKISIEDTAPDDNSSEPDEVESTNPEAEASEPEVSSTEEEKSEITPEEEPSMAEVQDVEPAPEVEEEASSDPDAGSEEVQTNAEPVSGEDPAQSVSSVDVTPAQFSMPSTTGEEAQTATIGVSASQMNKPPHRNNRKLAAIVTIIVAVVLAGTAVYVYLGAQSNTKKETTNSTEQTGETQEPVTPATASDVDQANSEVEAAINALDESADFAESDLSDATLGL